MAKTMQDLIVAGLKTFGSVQSDSKSHKYITLTRTSPGETPTFYFVGKKGALRIGQCSSKSIPASETFITKVIEAGRKYYLEGGK